MAEQLSQNYQQSIDRLDRLLEPDESFDLIKKDLQLVASKGRLYMIDGFVKDAVLFKLLSPIMSLTADKLQPCQGNAQAFVDRFLPYMEVECTQDVQMVCTQVLSGQVGLVLEGFSQAILIDARTYPTRSLSEPESDRVLRGARDSFCETLVSNTALIRRHVRDPRLKMQYFSIGKISKTDVVLCYFKEKADPKAVDVLTKKLKSLDVNSLSMAQESLMEALIKNHWYNPFPKVRYTERPDAAAATVVEGGILLIVDGTPSIMLLPTGFLDFFQDTNDYYFPPVVGTYLRFMRFIIHWLTLFLIPVWYVLIRNPQFIPTWLDFIQVNEMNKVPIFFQLMIVELIVDCLKQASLNTPAALGGSFAVVSALILGEFAVTARWFVPEVLLYMAFVAVANFAQPSYEMGYAVKMCRMLLIILTAFFNIWGFAVGVLITLFLIATTPTVTGQSYLYPLFPLNAQKLSRLLLRRRMNADNS